MGVRAAPTIAASACAAKPVSNSSDFTNFIYSFVAHLDQNISLQDIKSKLHERTASKCFMGAGLVVKCPHAPFENQCFFDPLKPDIFCAAAHQGDKPCACSCGGTNCNSTAAITDDAGAQALASLSASSTDGGGALGTLPRDNDDFAVFSATVESEPSPLSADIPCDPACYYKNCSRSPICAGGGDVVITRKVQSFAAHQNHSSPSSRKERVYEEFVLVDSGANRHFFGDSPLIMNRRAANLWMSAANGSRTHITEQGDILLRTTDTSGNELEPLILSDVSILKGNPLNLVSVGVLCEQGSTFHFEKNNSYLIYNGHQYKLHERDGLYLLRLDDILHAEDIKTLRDCEKSQCKENCLETIARSKSGKSYGCAATWDLWHERFGHASKKRIKFLFDNGAAEGLSVQGDMKHDAKCRCSTCSIVNNAKLHIGDTRQFADQVIQKGQLIYTDICGPFPLSVDGYRYVISFTDSYSRFSACYMLKRKSDSEAALKALIAFYARHGIIIKEIRSDQGGEFGGSNESPSVAGEGGSLRDEDSLSFFFQRLCKENGIKYVPMPANRPELHGLAERWNLTTVKLANAMLFSARLSHILWPAAVSHANVLRNRLPLRGLGPYTPYELFFNKRPRVDKLRVFGCDAYKLLPTYPKVPGQMARRRLIYVGETADRVGYRCFNPITYKFSTEFELIFDEASSKKRILSLLEYDERRDLKKKGKLHLLPLQADDSTSKIANKVRDVFSSPNPSPSIGILESGGEGGNEVDSKEDPKPKPGARSESVVEHGSSSREHCPASASSRPSSEREARSNDKSSEHDKRRPVHHSLRAPQNADFSTQHQEAPELMGNRGADREHSDDVCSIDRAAPSTYVEDADSLDANDEMLLRHPPLRPGRLPMLRSRKQAIVEEEEAIEKEKDSLTDLDGAIASLNDPEADAFGPLTKENLEKERERSKLDPRHPRRPLRLLPVGQIEKDTPEFKEFRKHALDNNIRIKLVDNPKQPGKESWRRYNKYQPATTLREIIELSTTAKNPKIRAEQRKKALDDIIFDSLRGYILYPQHEHNASAHFIDATELARQNGTINIHALYSVAEMKSARRKASQDLNEEIAASLQAHLATAKERELSQIPLTSFHHQIMSLWDYDQTLQLNDAELKKESAFASALVAEILLGDEPEPKDYRHAVSLSHPEREKWLESMAQERRTLEDRGTWVLVPRDSIGANRPVKCRYVYRKKILRDKSIQYKSRLVGCGYSQIAGLNYSVDETYAGVCSYSSLRFLLSLACQKGYIISQTDIQAAYLESYLREDQHVYMEVPPERLAMIKGANSCAK